METQDPAGTDLATLVKQTEGGHSLFEDAAREQPIPVCSVFLDKDGTIRPASFRETQTVFTCQEHNSILEVFPKTIAKSRNIILEAHPSEAHPAVAGKRVAVLFSGGPAAGGHNVLAGLKLVLGDDNTLLGIRKGPKGLLSGDVFEITKSDVDRIINTGGFNFLGTDRTKIKTPEQFEKVKNTVLENRLDGLIIVGGDDSNTNAAFIAEYLETEGIPCSVIGIPKTIDGDMAAGKYLPISFGYDTATKVYAELTGNLAQDAASAVKYYHFVKLMGRTASKITLEVALQTKPAIALISEEIAAENMSLGDIVDEIVRIIVLRRLKGINHGVVLVPEGLIEFVPEMRTLILELNRALADYERDIKDLPTLRNKLEFLYPHLSPQSAQLMASLPDEIEEMLILDRDDHGNVKVSQIETEKLLIDKIRYKMSEIKRHTEKYFGDGEGLVPASPQQIDKFKVATFSSQSHFLGYEGRSGKPTSFDAAFTFALGLTAGSLVLAGKTGYMAAVTDFDKGGTVLALPITGLITCEMRKGKEEMVIEKSLVELDSPAFKLFAAHREKWAQEDLFSSPGPIQHWGPASRQIPISVALNQGYADYRTFNLGEERKIRLE
ncbi:diphosphate--fructose-6-phosphate 1-phosphotransferase [Desulforhabdus sp. TSK]|uniref:diphosphate--fructose-6-phosphate 1-phosphotransferase n=1 Tax=Desulforhabdus sp. TSK TaxID=2925014 RepID=UPI001FC856C7|nr:diphosphate--fructose-6-phosphate 1-phosphotransferase [Desulforhabdus sp. TSK]GKT08636.1 pyrophosphate--fructose 6-phosphate 1-phosphotransferase [Desulforhabdus sp. TSK]